MRKHTCCNSKSQGATASFQVLFKTKNQTEHFAFNSTTKFTKTWNTFLQVTWFIWIDQLVTKHCTVSCGISIQGNSVASKTSRGSRKMMPLLTEFTPFIIFSGVDGVLKRKNTTPMKDLLFIFKFPLLPLFLKSCYSEQWRFGLEKLETLPKSGYW